MLVAANLFQWLTFALAFFAAGVGVYNSIQARNAQIWQRDRDEERQRTKVEVTFEHSTQPRPRYVIDLDRPIPPNEFDYKLGVRVTNRGEHPEFVRRIYVESGDVGQDVLDAPSPERVDPRGFRLWDLVVDFNHLKAGAPFSVTVELGSMTITENGTWNDLLLEDVV